METQNNTPAVVTKTDRLKLALANDSIQSQLKNALGENHAGFTASLIELFAGDTYLQECEPGAVIMAAFKAATMKLPINKALGFAFIVAYKQNGKSIPQFQIGYKGLIQLAIRTNMYKTINADSVFEGEYKLKNKLTGEFDLSGEKISDRVIGYFAHIELINGFSKTWYMTVEKVTAHAAKYSKSYNQQFSPWKTEFDAMAIKTVLRLLLSKYGYLSIDLVNALTDDDDAQSRVNNEIGANANQQFTDFTEVKSGPGNTPDGNEFVDFSNPGNSANKPSF